ncbi:MAG: 2-dehydropantoate 2-reductase [Candidatus Methylomirabilales bacterium]
MRIAVMGSGGIGGYFGGRLAQAGEPVTFIARGAHLRAIRERGLEVRSAAGDFHVRAAATDDPSRVGPVDLVLFAVKSYDTEEAGLACRPLLGPETGVLCLQNGVDNEDRLAKILGREHVLAGVVHILSTISAPGVIAQTAGPRTIRFAEMDGRTSTRSERILEVLAKAGIAATLSPNIQVDLWAKFLFIAAHGGVTALTRLPIGEILGCPETAAFYRAVMEEVAGVARAREIALPADAVETALAFARSLDPGMRSSLAHDLEQGRRLEIEALPGAVVRYGCEAGVPTPFNLAIYASLKPYHVRAERRVDRVPSA